MHASLRFTYDPQLLERIIVLERDDIIRYGNELEIVRRNGHIAQHALLFKYPRDQRGHPRDHEERISVLPRFPSVSLDLVFAASEQFASEIVGIGMNTDLLLFSRA